VDDLSASDAADKQPKLTRRRILAAGLGGFVVLLAAGAGGLELVSHGVLPGKLRLDEFEGACSLPDAALRFSELGPETSGQFYSAHRNRTVGFTIAYPPRHAPGDDLPLVVMLHGDGGNHKTAVAGMSPAQALALVVDDEPLAPMAMVTVDGGNRYWNPHPGDDPMGMVIDELIPRCQHLGLGRQPERLATMGISMGGYGALLLAEKNPHMFSAVAAISPAIWTSYDQARGANADAYASAEDFSANDAVTHASMLAGIPIRVASGVDDPFNPGVEALKVALPSGSVVDFSNGCHDHSYFVQQEPPSLAFLSRHLA
jgi:S-formylglutathione hydrolase FrmB